MKWVHASEKPEPVKKGDGQSIMVSAFMTSERGFAEMRQSEYQMIMALIKYSQTC
jgi:hypothetical protein